MDIVMEDSDTEVMEEYWNEHSGEDCIGLETIRHYSFFDTHDVSDFINNGRSLVYFVMVKDDT